MAGEVFEAEKNPFTSSREAQSSNLRIKVAKYPLSQVALRNLAFEDLSHVPIRNETASGNEKNERNSRERVAAVAAGARKHPRREGSKNLWCGGGGER